MNGLLKFGKKVAIVTGAGGGLGRHYALELAKRGCNVVVNDIGGSMTGDTSSKSDSAGKVVAEILQQGGHAIANYDSVLDGSSIVNHAMKEFGRCDIVINNAGTLRDRSFQKMTREEWRSVIDTHLHGTFEVSHAVWPIMVAQNLVELST